MTDAPETGYDANFDDLKPLPKWPKVVGIISIVLASLGLICNGCSAGMSAAAETMLGMAEEQMGPAPDVMKPSTGMIAVAVASFMWSGVLLVAGILTVARNPAGRITHLVYAVGGIILTCASTYLGLKSLEAVGEWARQNPDNQWAQNASPTMGMISITIGIVIGLGWPLFCLVWFGFIKKTRDDFTGGIEQVA